MYGHLAFLRDAFFGEGEKFIAESEVKYDRRHFAMLYLKYLYLHKMEYKWKH